MKYLFLLLFCSSTWAGGYAGFDMPKGTFALTFDDGPSNKTLTILNELDKHDIKATFFVVSDMTKEREWLVREEIARGHSVGCHSVSHPLMTRLKEGEWKRQIDDCVKILEKITGTKIDLFRFPYGESTPEMEEYVRSKGMKTILWNIDSLDWKKTPEEELKHLKWGINQQKRGVIIMHDIQRSTVIALPEILDYFQSLDSKFVKLKGYGN